LKHLLIIEDDPATLAGLIDLLDSEGYHVQGVMDGCGALKIAASKPLSIVLCDESLPAINGLQICQMMKILHPDIVLFLITDFCSSKLSETVKQFGVEKIFTKPIDVSEMLRTLTSFSRQLNIQKQYMIPLRTEI